MGNTPSITPKELCRILKKKGVELKHVKGSHHYFVHPISNKITVVPMHNKDLPIGTFLAILKQAGFDRSEL